MVNYPCYNILFWNSFLLTRLAALSLSGRAPAKGGEKLSPSGDCRRQPLTGGFRQEVQWGKPGKLCIARNFLPESGRQVQVFPRLRLASRGLWYSCRYTSSYLMVRHRRSVKMLSWARPRLSMLIWTPASLSNWIYCGLVN